MALHLKSGGQKAARKEDLRNASAVKPLPSTLCKDERKNVWQCMYVCMYVCTFGHACT